MSEIEVSREERDVEAKAYHERKKKEKDAPKPKSEKYIIENNKVLKITVMPNGNKYSTFIGHRKNCKDIIKKHGLDKR